MLLYDDDNSVFFFFRSASYLFYLIQSRFRQATTTARCATCYTHTHCILRTVPPNTIHTYKRHQLFSRTCYKIFNKVNNVNKSFTKKKKTPKKEKRNNHNNTHINYVLQSFVMFCVCVCCA